MPVSAEEQERTIDELFEAVGLRPEQKALFPHQFSGGQRQRIGIARALSTRPSLIICDEPVSALDVAVQAQILNLLKSLQAQFGLTYLFISHDLGVVQHMCDEIAVMYMGKIVEQADRDSFFAAPRHPYSRALLQAVPSINRPLEAPEARLVDGAIPDLTQPQAGCRFASRCSHAVPACGEQVPDLDYLETAAPHSVACHRVAEIGEGQAGSRLKPSCQTRFAASSRPVPMRTMRDELSSLSSRRIDIDQTSALLPDMKAVAEVNEALAADDLAADGGACPAKGGVVNDAIGCQRHRDEAVMRHCHISCVACGLSRASVSSMARISASSARATSTGASGCVAVR